MAAKVIKNSFSFSELFIIYHPIFLLVYYKLFSSQSLKRESLLSNSLYVNTQLVPHSIANSSNRTDVGSLTWNI